MKKVKFKPERSHYNDLGKVIEILVVCGIENTEGDEELDQLVDIIHALRGDDGVYYLAGFMDEYFKAISEQTFFPKFPANSLFNVAAFIASRAELKAIDVMLRKELENL